MSVLKIEGSMLSTMFIEGAGNLSKNSKIIDALNVFPVPDGDTGTNMNLTITSGLKEVKQEPSENASLVANRFAKGLLMGARGNSGVILSQLFRGFSKSIEKKDSITSRDLSEAFDYGVQMAYKAVMKPVEGTILTVAKDAAKAGMEASEKEENIITVMETVLKESKASLKRTPDLLPILKEVGVVDSGGQGLVMIYEGFLAALKGETLKDENFEEPDMEELVKLEHHQSAQSHMSTEDIEFGYCTEVMVEFDENSLVDHPYDEDAFRNQLSEHGDSLLVVSDQELLKIHIHAEYPGNVISAAQKYGSLVNVKIENMRVQHSTILNEEKNHPVTQGDTKKKNEKTEFAIITVSMGKGIAELFESLGAKKVIEGGQTMNPSTEDFIKAISECNAEKIIILPNNSNIIMAAEQASEVSELDVCVVPSKSVPQGLAAVLMFNPSNSLTENKEEMTESMSAVKTGEVTYAVRDTQLNGVQIKKGDFMGISEKEIVSTSSSVFEVSKNLLASMISSDSEIVTIIRGEDRSEEDLDELLTYIEKHYPDIEIEEHFGSQPLYSYIIAVE